MQNYPERQDHPSPRSRKSGTLIAALIVAAVALVVLLHATGVTGGLSH